ncbi:MAG: pyrimidine-nucleoside phosphorylase [Lachnospiraceae bacterium]|nr:pyrimidine-nucleoside phosphorylase [Lachnospiraceae bacterium]
MRMVDLIHKKRRGEELTDEEIRFFVNGVTDGSLPDYQISAFCMAVVFQSMSDREIATLTDAMAHSGDEIDLSEFGTLSVDKHSTGGVGDKTSLILAPIVAACGAKTAKMSGRGLGHTGGTVDKLESIPGYRVELSIEDFLKQSRDIGVCVIGQSADLAPADKRLYALRDVTATVEAIPLIVSSIMSKKLAAGAHSIVLDVTVGSGAFMKDIESAEVLARKMVDIGRRCGRNMAAVISNMDEPLGHAIGNLLEVEEAVAVLKGEVKGDVYEVSLELAAAMLSLVFGISHEEARKMADETITSGKAFAKFKEWIAYQGGDTACLDDPSKMARARFAHEVKAPKGGYITRMETEAIGNAAGLLGAGRMVKSDPIDPTAGIVLAKKTGEKVKKGDVLCTLYADKEELFPAAEKAFLGSLSFGRTKPGPEPLIYKIIR